MFGLNTFFGLMLQRGWGETLDWIGKWNRTMTVLDACVPDEKQAELRKSIEVENEGAWLHYGGGIFVKIASNTFALGIGWAVHTALTS